MLAVVYLIFNAGLTSPAEPSLWLEGIRLARILAALMPDEPEVAGLLALLLLTESRRSSRTAADGSLVLLGEQDRSRWDQALIEEGQAIVRACLRRNQPGAYQLQAAINAVHAEALSMEETDWFQIVALYDQLLAISPTPVVVMNRAIAIGEVQGPLRAAPTSQRRGPRQPAGLLDARRPRGSRDRVHLHQDRRASREQCPGQAGACATAPRPPPTRTGS